MNRISALIRETPEGPLALFLPCENTISSLIPLLGIYLEKTLIRKDTCTPMFIAALFTIAKA